jgi:hypothetical protein
MSAESVPKQALAGYQRWLNTTGEQYREAQKGKKAQWIGGSVVSEMVGEADVSPLLRIRLFALPPLFPTIFRISSTPNSPEVSRLVN